MSLTRFFSKLIFFCANLLLIITPFLFTWFNTELFEFNKMLFVYLMTLLITSAWIGKSLVLQKIVFKRSFFDLPLLALLIAQTLATIFSIHPYTSIFGYYSRFNGGLLSTFSYALLYWGCVNNLNKKQLLTLLKTAVLAGIGISLYAIPERVGVSPSCLIINNRFDVNCWVQDVRSRVFASFGQPNWLAAYLGMLLPLTIGFHLNTFVTRKKNLTLSTRFFPIKTLPIKSSFLNKVFTNRWAIASTLMFLALLLTQSRSGLLGFAMSLFFMMAYSFLTKQKNKKVLSSLSVWLIVIGFIVGTEFTPSLGKVLPIWQPGKQVSSLFSSSSTVNNNQDQVEAVSNITITPSEQIRLIVWKGAIKIWQRYPVLGSGPETFAYSYYLDRPMEHNQVSEWDFLYNKAHNELLNLLATTGVVGLSAYVLLMSSCFFVTGKLLWAGFKQKNKAQLEQPTANQLNLYLGITAGLIGFNITNLLGFSTVMVSVLWVFFMSYLGLAESKDKDLHQSSLATPTATPTNQSSFKKLSFFQIITLILLVLIVFHLSLKIVMIWQADHLHFKGKRQFSAQQYQAGVENLQKAVLLAPNEALFYDELADSYAKIAVRFFETKETEMAQQYAQLAQATSEQALTLNPFHLNFYRSQSSIYSQLSVVDERFLELSKQTLIQAQAMAPTDPKLVFQQGLLELTAGDKLLAIATIERAVEMKPNYHQARYRLGLIFENDGECEKALEQYQYILSNIIPGDNNLIEKIETLKTCE